MENITDAIDIAEFSKAGKEIPKEKTYKVKIDEKDFVFDHHIVSGQEVLEKANKTPVECYSLYIKLKHCDVDLIKPHDKVDLSEGGIEHFVTKPPVVFHYTVNSEPETTDESSLTPKQIMVFAGINPEKQYLVQLNNDGSETLYAYEPEVEIKMLCPKMKFVTRDWLDLIDIEEYGKTCKEVVPARKYRIKVDKDFHIWDNRYISTAKIIEFSGKTPADKQDVWKFYGNAPKPVRVDCDKLIDLFEKCLVRFVVLPKEQKDGYKTQRAFTLPQEDMDFLDELGLPWETISNNGMWLIIHDYPITKGYNVETASIALMIPPAYPAAEIDMANFCPPLQKQSGTINAATERAIEGRIFQQWSRHRQPGEWVPGVDNLSTHLGLVDNWLLIDLKR